VKIAVGKSVDCENIAGIFIQPALECQKGFAMGQFNRRLIAQPQADGEGFARADFFADGQRVVLQRGEDFRPRFAAMDVGAVGEVLAVAKFHDVRAE
jgi:hypothetical protein